jgi:hypothetical protein
MPITENAIRKKHEYKTEKTIFEPSKPKLNDLKIKNK